MKKISLYLFSTLLVAMLSVGFTSCGDDDDDDDGSGGGGSSSLSGWWMSESYDGWGGYKWCHALHFINGSVVDYYDDVASGRYWDDKYGNFSVAFGGKSGWYYQDGCETRYNYYIQNNILHLYNASSAKSINFFNGTPSGYSKVK